MIPMDRLNNGALFAREFQSLEVHFGHQRQVASITFSSRDLASSRTVGGHRGR